MKIALRAPNDLYVTAEQGGGIDTRDPATPVALRARATEIGPWETFELETIGLSGMGQVAIRTCNGNPITAENGGGGALRTNETEIGVWETFTYSDTLMAFATWDGRHLIGLAPGDDPIMDAGSPFQRLVIEELEAPRPALDRRRFRASYCSHRDHASAVVFDPIYFGCHWNTRNFATLDQCLAVKRNLGIDAIQLCVQGGYGSYMGGATFDFRHTPDVYAELCRYVADSGFTPIMLVGTADGGCYEEIYNGTMGRILVALDSLVEKGWYCAGYEQDLDRGGGYSARQMDDALLLMRSTLGSAALLMLWLQPNRCTPASYYGSDPNHQPSASVPLRWIGTSTSGAWIEADDPYEGSEQGAWYISGGLEIDGLWYQTPHGNDGPAYTSGGPGLDQYGQPRYLDRVIECADRFLAPGTPMPGALGHKSDDGRGGYVVHSSGVAPSVPGAPDWFHEARPRGRPIFAVGETVPYEYSRDACSDEAVQTCSRLMESVGLPVQGCWQP